MRNSSKLGRVDKEFDIKMRDIMKERLKKNLAEMNPKDLGLPEATRLVLRTPSWKNVELELRTMPKRKER